jgi:hypothetical protein
MLRRMPRYAKVEFDKALDVAHIQYLPVALETAAEVAAFAKEIDREMTKLGRKVDIIVDLGDLVVKPAAVAAYDVERQRMFAAYALRAYRYHGSSLVRTRILTSSTLHDQRANVFPSFEEARDALLADRQRSR